MLVESAANERKRPSGVMPRSSIWPSVGSPLALRVSTTVVPAARSRVIRTTRSWPLCRKSSTPNISLDRPLDELAARQPRRQLDVDLERREAVAPLEVDLDLVLVDLDVLPDHLEQLALQEGQEVRRHPAGPLVRDQHLQPLLGLNRGLRPPREPEELQQSHAVLRSSRWTKLRRGGATNRISSCSPSSRLTASL